MPQWLLNDLPLRAVCLVTVLMFFQHWRFGAVLVINDNPRVIVVSFAIHFRWFNVQSAFVYLVELLIVPWPNVLSTRLEWRNISLLNVLYMSIVYFGYPWIVIGAFEYSYNMHHIMNCIELVSWRLHNSSSFWRLTKDICRFNDMLSSAYLYLALMLFRNSVLPIVLVKCSMVFSMLNIILTAWHIRRWY